jgi:hypothetical protein
MLAPVNGEINRFLFCVLVSKSAKQIKSRAEQAGETLPMAAVVRRLLRSYRLAAKETPGLLAGLEFQLPNAASLNEKILKEEIRRSAQERVKDNEARLARAHRLGDETGIKAEQEALRHAIANRDRLVGEFK